MTFNFGEPDKLSFQFRTADPFPHIAIDNFLNAPREDVLQAYPSPDWPHWSKFKDYYQRRKMVCNDLSVIPPPLASLMIEMMSPPFLQFIQQLTGITGLIPDPYFDGGGLHCSGTGGILAPHTDFHFHERLGLYRRLNLLLYLNPEWQEEYGGCLELYKKGESTPTQIVVPEWGRCVIFQTDDKSVHGFSKPVVGERWRRSIALYYYTSSETPGFSGDTSTHWQTHGNWTGIHKLRLHGYKALMSASRHMSGIAHRVNPNRARL